MKQVTIVFVHRGPSVYLYYVVKQARRWNPTAEIVVLSDIPRPELRHYAKIALIADYARSATEFARIYQHLSVNPYEFELFCFQRWFVLRDYLAKHPTAHLVHLDSDVLTYTAFGPEFVRLSDFDVGIVGLQGPQSMLVASDRFIPALCDHITRLFTDESHLLAEMYAEWRKQTDSTAVSDMHALHTLLAQGTFRKLDLAEVRDDCAYDGTIHEAEGYEIVDGQKRLTWRADQPWARRSDTGTQVCLRTLHCQGPSKPCIFEHFKARDLRYYLDRLRARLFQRP